MENASKIFLLKGLQAILKVYLVYHCLQFMYQCGVTVISITFDRHTANVLITHLRADFINPLDLKASFKHPITNNDIFIFLDICHKIKLIRNCFGS